MFFQRARVFIVCVRETYVYQVVRVLRVWQAWSVFPTSLLEDLECLLLKGLTVAEDKAAALAAAAATTNSELDGVPLSARCDPNQLSLSRSLSLSLSL
jgi:hypothetical protein